MVLLPLKTQSAPGVSLFAPASGGGGGGNVSSISTISSGGNSVNCDASGVFVVALDYITGGAGYVSWNNTVCLPAGTLSTTSIEVSSINGQQPGAVDPNPSFSTIALAQNGEITYTGIMKITSEQTAVNDFQFTSPNDFQPLYPQGLNSTLAVLLTMTSPADACRMTAAVADDEAIFIQTSATGGAPAIYVNAGAVETDKVVCSTLFVSTVNNFVPMGTAAGQQMPGDFQAGYVSQLPYNSTVLFAHPYSDDKVSVMLTPTNTGVSGGANPNISLNAAYGTNGVSSIGFAVDMRNAGIGFQGDFYYMAFPWTN